MAENPYRTIAYKAINNHKHAKGFTGTMIILNPENPEIFKIYLSMRSGGVRHAAYRYLVDFPEVTDIIAFFDAEFQGDIVESFCVTNDGRVWQYYAGNCLTAEERVSYEQGARGVHGSDKPWEFESSETAQGPVSPATCSQPWRLRYKKMHAEAC